MMMPKHFTRPKGLVSVFVVFVLWSCIALTNTALGQAMDCYPNCSVTVRAVLNERVPLYASVPAIANHCYDDVITTMLKQFEDDDMRNIVKYRNEYCSALSGWIAVGNCEHGGPPPCCPITGAAAPWRNIGSESAKARLMNTWHKLKNERHDQIEKALNACLRELTSSRLSEFNSLYSDALSCWQTLNQNKNYMTTHSVIVNSYVSQLNTLHAAAQGWVNSKDPNNLQNDISYLQKLKSEICNTATSAEFKSSASKNDNPNPVKTNNTNSTPSPAGQQNNSSNNRGSNNTRPTNQNQTGNLSNTRQQPASTTSVSRNVSTTPSNAQSNMESTGLSNAQSNIERSSNATNPIMQATYLSQAKIQLTYEQSHGGNPATIQRLRQQIFTLENQQNKQNLQNVQNQLNQLVGAPTPQDAQQNLDNLIDKNIQLEREKSNNKEDVKHSLNDFFNSVKFPNKPADTPAKKTDTTKASRLKKIQSAHN